MNTINPIDFRREIVPVDLETRLGGPLQVYSHGSNLGISWGCDNLKNSGKDGCSSQQEFGSNLFRNSGTEERPKRHKCPKCGHEFD